MSDTHTVLEIIAFLAMVAMSIIGYKVHSILFTMRIPERLALLEDSRKEHDRRLGNLEKVVFKIGGL